MAFKTKPNVEKALSQFMEIATTEVFKWGYTSVVDVKMTVNVRDLHFDKQLLEMGLSPMALTSLYCNFWQLVHNISALCCITTSPTKEDMVLWKKSNLHLVNHEWKFGKTKTEML